MMSKLSYLNDLADSSVNAGCRACCHRTLVEKMFAIHGNVELLKRDSHQRRPVETGFGRREVEFDL